MPDSFQTLPPEVLEMILKFLDDDDRIRLFMASKHVRNVLLSKKDLGKLVQRYEFNGRPVLGVPRLQKFKMDFNFQLNTADLYATAFEDLCNAAFSSLRFSKNNDNEAGNVFIAVTPSIRHACIFAKFVKEQLAVREIDCIQVHQSGGYVTDATRDRLRTASKKKTAVILITNRSNGTLMRPNKIVFIEPTSVDVVNRGLKTGPSAAAIHWPLWLDRSQAYINIKLFCSIYDRTICHASVCRCSPKPELLFLPEGL